MSDRLSRDEAIALATTDPFLFSLHAVAEAQDRRRAGSGKAMAKLLRESITEITRCRAEVQELRHLRDNVLPDLREELGMANAYLADCRRLITDLRALPYTAIATDLLTQMIDGAGL